MLHDGHDLPQLKFIVQVQLPELVFDAVPLLLRRWLSGLQCKDLILRNAYCTADVHAVWM